MIGFNSSRLKAAREKNNLTQSDLAQLCNIDSRSVIAHENGDYSPKEDNIIQYSKALRMPVSFFYGDDLDEIHRENISFRNLSKLSGRKIRQMIAFAQISICIIDKWILDEFDLPTSSLPEFTNLPLEKISNAHVEVIAQELRALWGVSLVKPISNLMDLVESNGIRVFSIPPSLSSVDTFSLWHDEKPYIFLKEYKYVEESRFSIAHEIGHLIMHMHGQQPYGQIAEQQANLFASAFLLPEKNIKSKMLKVSNIYMLIEMKKEWKVSWRQLNNRLYSLGLISDWNFKQTNSDGVKLFSNIEPESAEKEESQIFKKIFVVLRNDGIYVNDIIDQLSINLDDLAHLTFEQARNFEKIAQQKRSIMKIVV